MRAPSAESSTGTAAPMAMPRISGNAWANSIAPVTESACRMPTAADSCQIRILEIYASDEAYQSHLKTDHFQRYKQGTAHMVKSLSLPAMQPLDPAMMPHIFRKQPLSD